MDMASIYIQKMKKKKIRSVLLFWDKRSIQITSYLAQTVISISFFFLKVRHKFLIIAVVPRKIQVSYLDTSYRTKHSFLRPKIQTGDQGELHGRACVRKNRIEGRVSVHSSTPLFLPNSKQTHNNNNNK